MVEQVGEFNAPKDLETKGKLFLSLLDTIISQNNRSAAENPNRVPLIDSLDPFDSLTLSWQPEDDREKFDRLAVQSGNLFTIDGEVRGGIVFHDPHTAKVFAGLAFQHCFYLASKTSENSVVGPFAQEMASEAITHELDHAVRAGEYGASNSPQHADVTKIGMKLTKADGQIKPQFYYSHREYIGDKRQADEAADYLHKLFDENPDRLKLEGLPSDPDYAERNVNIAIYAPAARALANYLTAVNIDISHAPRKLSAGERDYHLQKPWIREILTMSDDDFIRKYISQSGKPHTNDGNKKEYSVVEGLTALALNPLQNS